MTKAPSSAKRHRQENGEVRLQLTSMMDMFTILLVFLLKAYSTQGQLVNPSEDLTLPTSISQQEPELGLDLQISKDWILVNGKTVIRTSDVLSMDAYLIPALYSSLDRYATEAEKLVRRAGTKFSGKITIQGDRDLPYRLLMKVMVTCGQSRYPNMRLVVYQKEE